MYISRKAVNAVTALKILSVGNSFSVDTMEHTAGILKSLGVSEFKLGNLYIGGCSVRRHFENITKDLPLYEYFVNTGDGWTSTLDHSIREIIQSDDWDIISIQHGTADGSCNSESIYFDRLEELVAHIKALAPRAKIAFNMTWVGEPYHQHHEIVANGGDTMRLYQKIARVMRETVQPTAGLDVLSPTGTAIQNARTVIPFELTRDGYHLSLGLGRYIAGLTFVKALTGMDIDGVSFMPEGVDEPLRQIAVKAASAAIVTPFAVTAL